MRHLPGRVYTFEMNIKESFQKIFNPGSLVIIKQYYVKKWIFQSYPYAQWTKLIYTLYQKQYPIQKTFVKVPLPIKTSFSWHFTKLYKCCCNCVWRVTMKNSCKYCVSINPSVLSVISVIINQECTIYWRDMRVLIMQPKLSI